MRTTPLVALTAAASAALAAPLAIVVHEHAHHSFDVGAFAQRVEQGLGGTTSGRSSTGSTTGGQGQSAPQPDGSTGRAGTGGSANGDSGSGSTTDQSTGSGTTTKATTAQSKGVVMIDVALTNGQAAGSGMVLTPDGTVLTNYHVVSGSTQIRVTVPGGQSYTATVVGHDQSHDVAVLKLAGAKNLATVRLDTDGVSLSEKVLAVGQGNGEGVLYAASGIVTATQRSITASEQGALSSGEALSNLVQTNANIVPGYSGGPLFDADGEVIGIDTAAASTNSLTGYRAQASEGYAIPITQAKSIADTILAGAKTATNHIGTRAALGIAVMPSDQRGGGSGVTVQQLLSGSAMSRTGLEAGDVITGIGGKSVASSDDLSAIMDAQYPGTTTKVTWTDTSGTTHTSTVSLGKATTN